VNAVLWDGPDPWIGDPALSDAQCRYYTFDAQSCGDCGTGNVCSVAGECVPERRTIKDVRLTITHGADTATFDADPTTGQIYGALAFAGPYDVTLTWAAAEVAVTLPFAETLDATIVAESDQYDAPGDLTVSWTPSDGYLYATIPVNHHAGGPTFTTCLAPGDLGGFVIDGAMVDPLSVITGLEFQGMDHVNAAAVRHGDACVDFRAGTRLPAYVQTPPS
jgi:hypothetical protein